MKQETIRGNRKLIQLLKSNIEFCKGKKLYFTSKLKSKKVKK